MLIPHRVSFDRSSSTTRQASSVDRLEIDADRLAALSECSPLTNTQLLTVIQSA
jgi:hypothetical protein